MDSKPILLRQTDTDDGHINVIIDERWAAMFPKESAGQVDALITATNCAFQEKLGFK